MREERRFEDLVRDLHVNDAMFWRSMRRLSPADRAYVVIFSARSGSTWLTSMLKATGRLGYPEEYLNPLFVRDVAKAQNSRDPEGVLQMLKRRRKTPNGVFGIEVRSIDVILFGQRAFFEVFDRGTVFFHLWRDNIIAQGISLFRALSTRHFHSTGDGENVAVPPYDVDGILQCISRVASAENSNVELLQRARRQARGLRYEDIVNDRAGTIDAFARVLNVPTQPGEFGEPMEGELRKIGDAWNVDAERNFRVERADFVADIEAARLVKIGVAVDASNVASAGQAPNAAYLDGRQAGAAGKSPRSNPYPNDVAQSTRWREGWNDGWDTQVRVPRDAQATGPLATDAASPPQSSKEW